MGEFAISAGNSKPKRQCGSVMLQAGMWARLPRASALIHPSRFTEIFNSLKIKTRIPFKHLKVVGWCGGTYSSCLSRLILTLESASSTTRCCCVSTCCCSLPGFLPDCGLLTALIGPSFSCMSSAIVCKKRRLIFEHNIQISPIPINVKGTSKWASLWSSRCRR